MVFWEFDISNHNFHILTLSSYSYLLFFNLLFWTSSFVIFFKYNFNWTGYALINLTILVFFCLPYGLLIINLFGIPFLNICILLRRGVSVTWCHYNMISNCSGVFSLILTIFLALLFVGVQAMEYYKLFFTISDRIFGSIFFFSTGFHGLHVIFGSLFLIVNLFRLFHYHYIFSHHLGLEFSILYWHFVDVVWLFLFVFVYWWSY